MLQIQNISKTFPFASEPTLRNLNLELKESEFSILIGGNGSGKSTLLKLIQGELKSDSGDIFLREKRLTNLSLSQRSSYISTVSQDVHSGTVKEMTLLENLVLSLNRGKSSHFSSVALHKQECVDHVKKLGLGFEKFMDTPMIQLSGGQKQILALVMATALKPDVLLLDEHCSALDPKSSQLLMSYTDRIIREYKLTTLMVTHSLTDALRYGDRLIMLREGRVILDVRGAEKKSLTMKQVLDLYHNYEDNSLL